MEDKQNNALSSQGGCKLCRLGNRYCNGIAPFVIGIVVALVFGWCIFPSLMFSNELQPVRFSHKTHVMNASLDCNVCHKLRPDGTFDALPSTADCASCHARELGKSQAERNFVANYVRQGKEVKWLAYQRQPDNVYFNHTIHSLDRCNQCHQFSERELCENCHIDLVNMERSPVVGENILSSYSRETMKMWQCERCHANPNHLGSTNANNACFVCHK